MRQMILYKNYRCKRNRGIESTKLKSFLKLITKDLLKNKLTDGNLINQFLKMVSHVSRLEKQSQLSIKIISNITVVKIKQVYRNPILIEQLIKTLYLLLISTSS